jgi:hypothetical protein
VCIGARIGHKFTAVDATDRVKLAGAEDKQPPRPAALLLCLAGWVALAVAVLLSTIKLTWWWGTSKKHNYVRLNQVRHIALTSLY